LALAPAISSVLRLAMILGSFLAGGIPYGLLPATSPISTSYPLSSLA